jgi:hypothetical protein
MALEPIDTKGLSEAPNERAFNIVLKRLFGVVSANFAWLQGQITALSDSIGSIEITTGGGIQGGGPLSDLEPIELIPTGVDPGTYGDSLNVPVVTVDEHGRVTDVTNATLTDPVAMAIIFGA